MGHPNPVGPVVIHCADAIQYANRTFCALLGVDSPAELTGTSLLELVEPSCHESLTERFDQLPRDDDLVSGVRLELLDTDGSSHEVIALSSLRRWEGDQRIQTAFITLSMDATAHR